jgi:FkbM family methyltransferase
MSAFDKFPVFIDVGASDGRIWRSWIKEAPDAHIYAFEPDPTNFNAMQQHQSGRPNVIMQEVAISTVDSPSGIPFYISNDRNSSSVYPYNVDNIRKWKYPPGRRLFKTDKIIQVPAMRLDTLIKKERLRYIDFIKIDVQGHELEVLKSLGNSISKVREIVLEASLTPFDIYEGQTNQIDNITAFMTENGFKIHKQDKLSRNQEINIWFINTRFSKIQRNKFYHFDMPK